MPSKGWKKAPDGTWTPPNKVVHVLDLEEDTQEFLEEMMDKWLAGKAIRAAGHAAQGFLSNPLNALWIGGGILAVLATLAGKEKLESVVSYFQSLQTVLSAESKEDKSAAASQLIVDMRALIRALSPLGPLTPLP